MVVRKIGPRIWLSFLVVAWGLSVFGMGFVHHWGALTACRLLLGMFEAGCQFPMRTGSVAYLLIFNQCFLVQYSSLARGTPSTKLQRGWLPSTAFQPFAQRSALSLHMRFH